MTTLSPAAQAVEDAYDKGCIKASLWNWERSYNAVGAALRAAADQVVPAENAPALMRGPDLERLAQRQHTRAGFLAIADELEEQS